MAIRISFIGIKSGSYSYKTIDQPCDYCDNKVEVLNLNSYLFNNDLYYVKVCHEGLQLNINNILTGDNLGKFISKAGEKVDFKNSPFIKMEGADNRSDIDKNISFIYDQKSFLRKASADDLIVAAEHDSSQNILLRVGAIDVLTLEERERMAMYPGSGILPSLAVSLIAPPDWSKLVYFQSRLEALTYKHLEGNMPFMTEEKIAALTASKKIKAKYKLLLKYSNTNYFVYYDKDTDSFIFSRL